MLNDVESSLSVLRQGGTLLYPTDTVWGLGCDATNEEAVEKIIALKNRPPKKSFVVLATEKMLLQHVATLDLAIYDYLEQVTKPTTVIYEHAIGLAPNAIAEDGSIAIRLCKEPFCTALLHRFKKPILSTSANLSGLPAPGIFKEIDARIIAAADYVVHYRRDDETQVAPSAIVKWKDGHIEVIRE